MTGDRVSERLARELYWAEEVSRPSSMTTSELRDGMRDLSAHLREDAKQRWPSGEVNLGATSRLRRGFKRGTFGALRFISRRYDRLLADQAEYVTALAERVRDLEAEVEALRARMGDEDGPEEPRD